MAKTIMMMMMVNTVEHSLTLVEALLVLEEMVLAKGDFKWFMHRKVFQT